MAPLTVLADYADGSGNTISSPRQVTDNISIDFRGSHNRLIVNRHSKLRRLNVVFHGNEGLVTIGHNDTVGTPQLNLRVGYGGKISIGNNLSTTTTAFISAVEGTTVTIGDDVMCATHVHFRTDDSHAIYDVASRQRINISRDITIGDHVWIGYEARLLHGAAIGSGSVIGTGSIVTSPVPNNCIAVGAPARVVRRNIAWERPYLWLSEAPAEWPPFDGRPPKHWRMTEEL